MSHVNYPYAIEVAIPSSGIRNGSIVTFVTEAGAVSVQKRAPDVNQYVDSGVLNTLTSGRFHEHYGGGAS